MGEVVGARVVGDGLGDVLSWQRHRLGAEALGQAHRLGDPVALRVAQVQVAAGLDMDRGPWRPQAVRHALGEPDHIGAAGIAADTRQYTLAGGPGPGIACACI